MFPRGTRFASRDISDFIENAFLWISRQRGALLEDLGLQGFEPWTSSTRTTICPFGKKWQ